MTRATLFTPFAPGIGGGGTILRSLLPTLRDVHSVEVEWCYASPQEQAPDDLQMSCSRLASGLMGTGGRSLAEIGALWLVGAKTARFQKVVQQLLTREADVYWIVGHMEAILLAQALARHGRRVHLTMHDDLAHGQFARSSRYRFLTSIADRRLGQAIRASKTLDVVCRGMEEYYREKFHAGSITVHRLVPSLPPVSTFTAVPSEASGELVVGHIGSIYSMPEFQAFCDALRRYAKGRGLRCRFLVIAGRTPKTRAGLEENADIVEDLPHMDETEAVRLLGGCHFVYAMYPFSSSMAVFRRTSSPTKLTAYLQAQRPILGHTPSDSSLQNIVTDYGLGVICNSLETTALDLAVAQAHRNSKDGAIPYDNFEAARMKLHGEENVRLLAECLKTGHI